jgi:hypothetical protein
MPKLREVRRGRVHRPPAGRVAERQDSPTGLSVLLPDDSGTDVIELPAIFDRIRQEPDAEAHWLALTGWCADNGYADMALVVRHFWPALRDAIGPNMPLEQMLEIAPKDASRLAKVGPV